MPDITVGHTRNVLNENSLTFEEREKELDRMEQAEQEARARDKKSAYKSFVQLNNAHQKDLRALARKNVNAFMIFSFFMEHMNGYNALMCSYKVIQEALGIKRTTASNAIKLLVERGFIHIKRTGGSNVYILNDDLVWKSWGKNMRYCEFPSNVILSMSEQTEEEKSVVEERNTIVSMPKNEPESV
jgi:DNA-binding MarR family transcriptional regulator